MNPTKFIEKARKITKGEVSIDEDYNEEGVEMDRDSEELET